MICQQLGSFETSRVQSVHSSKRAVDQADAVDEPELLASKMGVTVLHAKESAKDEHAVRVHKENGGEWKCVKPQSQSPCSESDVSARPRETSESEMEAPQIAPSVVRYNAFSRASSLEPDPVVRGKLAVRRKMLRPPSELEVTHTARSALLLRTQSASDVGPAKKAPRELRLRTGFKERSDPAPFQNKQQEHQPLLQNMSVASQFFLVMIVVFSLFKNFVLAPVRLFLALCSSQPPWCPPSPGSPERRQIEQRHLRCLVRGAPCTPQWLAFEAFEAFSTDPTNL